MKKRVVSVVLAMIMMASTLPGCSQKAADSNQAVDSGSGRRAESGQTDDKFYIYSWNTELQDRLAYVYEMYPELEEKVVYVNIGNTDIYQEKIDQLLQLPDAADYPDMIAFEDAYIKKYTNSDYTLPIGDLGIEESDLAQMYPYTLEVPLDQRDNSIKALSWQSCPGAFMYREDLAEEYLGVKTPEEMQARIGTWDDFLATAREIKEASGDKTRMLSSSEDISYAVKSDKIEPWVDSESVFHIDAAMDRYIDLYKILEDENLTQKTTPWSDDWNAGPSADSVFGYFGCTWFLHWIGKANCGATFNEDGTVDTAQAMGTYGKWKMCQGPGAYYWGGTFVGATAECSDKEIAGKILKALCCDTETAKKMAEGTLDYVNNIEAMQTLADEGKGEYDLLGGQDFIKTFMPMAEEIDAPWISAFDKSIEAVFILQLKTYGIGDKDKETMLRDFKDAVKEAYPDLTVE